VNETLGERVRRLRVARKISCAELSRRVSLVLGYDFSESAMRSVENGRTLGVSLPVGIAIAYVLDVRASYLATGERSPGAFGNEKSLC
jgi:transcriptional regulator with XRE-family HTH domain